MNVYSYSKPSIIDEVSFEKTAGGSARAYIHAVDGISDKQLCDISDSLMKKGWQCIPYMREGMPVLEVRGFSRDSQVITHLIHKGALVGIPSQVKDVEEKLSFVEKVKKRSLFASGAAFIAGDIGFVSYGYKGGSKLDITAGIAYALGTLSTLAFARKDQSDLQVKDISKQMAAYMRTQKMEVPEDCSVSNLNENNLPTLKKVDEHLRHYPSEMFNIFTGLAGVCVALAAYKEKAVGLPAPHAVEELAGKLMAAGKVVNTDVAQKQAYAKVMKNMRKEGWADVGLGVMTAASCAFGTLVKEKAHDPDAAEKHGTEAMWQWMQEHPLSITGGGLLVSTMCHAWSTAVAWKSGDSERRKAVPWRALFVAANLVAETLIAISSKGHGDGVVSDYSVDQSVIALAADLIAQQPKRLQPVLIQHVSNFLGQPNVLALKDMDVTRELSTQVEQMRSNPWIKAQIAEGKHKKLAAKPEEKLAQKVEAPAVAGAAPEATAAAPVPEQHEPTKEGTSSTWQEHVVQQQQAAVKPPILH